MNGKFPSNPFPVDLKVVDLFSAAADHLYDFGFAVPTDVTLESQFHDSVNDCMVPVQKTSPTKNSQPPQTVDRQSSSSPLHSHNVSSSLMDVGVVSEQNTMLNVSYPFMLPVNDVVSDKNIDGTNDAHKATHMDRMGRVLRYREKKKNRKFEKKI
ncbi:hypothetical protein L2E82_47794 [Cichorium intybus]|uniref:Uncharacterized protein n=1 Tax=Cichorium intybus TaxID=13427 RepID=A0ACB8YWQ7_CICIN|nr:hypothetical protein L2E82_47794 [Cichorium intybus]